MCSLSVALSWRCQFTSARLGPCQFESPPVSCGAGAISRLPRGPKTGFSVSYPLTIKKLCVRVSKSVQKDPLSQYDHPVLLVEGPSEPIHGPSLSRWVLFSPEVPTPVRSQSVPTLAEIFQAQIDRITQLLRATQPHAPGPRKPTLGDQDYSAR